VLDAAEFRLAKFRKYIGDGLAGVFDDALIEVHMQPSNLTSEQARDGGFAAAHESGKADESAHTYFVNHWKRMPVMELRNCGMAQSITFKDIDCTIEGGQFNFSAASIEGAEQAVAKAAVEMLLMVLGSEACLVDYFPL